MKFVMRQRRVVATLRALTIRPASVPFDVHVDVADLVSVYCGAGGLTCMLTKVTSPAPSLYQRLRVLIRRVETGVRAERGRNAP